MAIGALPSKDPGTEWKPSKDLVSGTVYLLTAELRAPEEFRDI